MKQKRVRGWYVNQSGKCLSPDCKHSLIRLQYVCDVCGRLTMGGMEDFWLWLIDYRMADSVHQKEMTTIVRCPTHTTEWAIRESMHYKRWKWVRRWLETGKRYAHLHPRPANEFTAMPYI